MPLLNPDQISHLTEFSKTPVGKKIIGGFLLAVITLPTTIIAWVLTGRIHIFLASCGLAGLGLGTVGVFQYLQNNKK